ncbi:hypothetical protein EYF80_053532 [Liparis tanakae]|uniref:Uncharacterized protein n=1 Tax=Liparis tanakae TaxID=230148 RepID=A0A4Z2F6C4_9TELE|nr:hypothetical protein EYF80_053532 [Liparis tanakae]
MLTPSRSPVTPQSLVAGEGLDEVRAQLHLLVEQLKDRGGADRLLFLLLLFLLRARELPIGRVVVRGGGAALVLGGTAVVSKTLFPPCRVKLTTGTRAPAPEPFTRRCNSGGARLPPYLGVPVGHVPQHPDAVRPGVVVAGVAAGGVRAHLHLLVERPGQVLAGPRARGRGGLLVLTARGGGLTQDLLQHPAKLLPVDPRLGALGELGEGQLAQVEVLLGAEGSALQQLLPATTSGGQSRAAAHNRRRRASTSPWPRRRARPYLTFHAVVKSGFSSNRVQRSSGRGGASPWRSSQSLRWRWSSSLLWTYGSRNLTHQLSTPSLFSTSTMGLRL